MITFPGLPLLPGGFLSFIIQIHCASIPTSSPMWQLEGSTQVRPLLLGGTALCGCKCLKSIQTAFESLFLRRAVGGSNPKGPAEEGGSHPQAEAVLVQTSSGTPAESEPE